MTYGNFWRKLFRETLTRKLCLARQWYHQLSHRLPCLSNQRWKNVTKVFVKFYSYINKTIPKNQEICTLFNNGFTFDCDPTLLPQNYLDPCGLPYNPQLNNVMTWNINCLEGFTNLQMVKMKQTIAELNLQIENCSSSSSSTF